MTNKLILTISLVILASLNQGRVVGSRVRDRHHLVLESQRGSRLLLLIEPAHRSYFDEPEVEEENNLLFERKPLQAGWPLRFRVVTGSLTGVVRNETCSCLADKEPGSYEADVTGSFESGRFSFDGSWPLMEEVENWSIFLFTLEASSRWGHAISSRTCYATLTWRNRGSMSNCSIYFDRPSLWIDQQRFASNGQVLIK